MAKGKRHAHATCHYMSFRNGQQGGQRGEQKGNSTPNGKPFYQ
jgi:hypothetical protein